MSASVRRQTTVRQCTFEVYQCTIGSNYPHGATLKMTARRILGRDHFLSLLSCVSGELEKCCTMSHALWRALPQPRARVCTVACLSPWLVRANIWESIYTPSVHFSSQQLPRYATVINGPESAPSRRRPTTSFSAIVLCIISRLAYI